MFAVVKCGSKDYKVSAGDVIDVEKLDRTVGSVIKLDQVLLRSSGKKLEIGYPAVKGLVVEASIVEHFKDRKILVFKKKRRKNYRRKNGHRQNLTKIKIIKI
ncbi:50S ribosomal protein L21 [Rickettsia endosymbiont of Cardiosporidium cionae]|uniref:50S ribosomal protein L21 n=1 Tax=Rickettsia endosymbiont of Cardiosporidium cionae TaxID=2777155 RepID=UPI001894BD42|nr:50S ribosomal protein L21 [Rickettsia endosymbiont of Cardiosporidium cionae]KAF8818666.1 50S ribosomal protein L21 [Rickettsia endosymbiont of Cardiosporidium cionae]